MHRTLQPKPLHGLGLTMRQSRPNYTNIKPKLHHSQAQTTNHTRPPTPAKGDQSLSDKARIGGENIVRQQLISYLCSMDITPNTRAFIANHAEDNVQELALKAHGTDDIDLPFALTQIEGRQIAARKLPAMAANPDIVWPERVALEQCSGEQTAAIKADIVRQLLPEEHRTSLLDVTGGFGIDFLCLAPLFQKATYLELNPALRDTVSHNLKALSIAANTVCGDGVEYLKRLKEPASLLYIDPSRRGDSGQRVYAITDCKPNVRALLSDILAKSRMALIKLSPMLDIHSTVSELHMAKHVYIVGNGNECKELLVAVSKAAEENPMVTCIDGPWTFEARLNSGKKPVYAETIEPGMFLYEPGPAVMKTGLFGDLCAQTGTQMVGINSHLFVSHRQATAFPGREFTLLAAIPAHRKPLKATIGRAGQANISVRNFPASAETVKKRFGIKDGGDHYVFATTLAKGVHRMLVCKKTR